MRDLVNDNGSLILILGRFGISLGFGDKSVREVCKMYNVDENTFLQVVNFSSKNPSDFRLVSLKSLLYYLRQAHEYYLEYNLPNIRKRLIDSIDCSGTDELAMLILKFYDEYVAEVRKHMEYENNIVFEYVDRLLSGYMNRSYNISAFESKHNYIGNKLKELKDVIIRYFPQRNNYQLNEVLLNIISCEEDLDIHCQMEDKLFIPAVKMVEQQLRKSGQSAYVDDFGSENFDSEKNDTLSDREKDVLIGIAKGLSNKEIADKLCLSVHTVATHRRNISGKLQIHSMAGLIIYAIANKLINIEDVK